MLFLLLSETYSSKYQSMSKWYAFFQARSSLHLAASRKISFLLVQIALRLLTEDCRSSGDGHHIAMPNEAPPAMNDNTTLENPTIPPARRPSITVYALKAEPPVSNIPPTLVITFCICEPSAARLARVNHEYPGPLLRSCSLVSPRNTCARSPAIMPSTLRPASTPPTILATREPIGPAEIQPSAFKMKSMTS